MAELEARCRTMRAPTLEATGLRSLGRGVAIAFASPSLVQLRQGLATEWRDWLTPQDSAKISPHVTIQNKVAPDLARRTLHDLQAEFRPFAATAEGLNLWRYLGGPWEPLRRFRFAG